MSLKIHSKVARKASFHPPAERAGKELGESEVTEGEWGGGSTRLRPLSLRPILDLLENLFAA